MSFEDPDFRAASISGGTFPQHASHSQHGHHSHHSHHRKHRRRALKIILIVLLALIVGAGIAVAAFVHAADQRLGFDDSQSASEVEQALTPADSNQPFYVLVLGSDSRSATESDAKTGISTGTSYSDVMMLVRVDTANKKISLLSIPRDTRWYDSSTGQVKKINAAYLDGPARSVQAVEQLTGISISHYAQLNVAGFEELVDTLGGVTVDVPATVTMNDIITGQSVTVQQGVQTLNGAQAIAVARARHEYGDNQEAIRQSLNRQIIESLVNSIRQQPLNEMPNLVLDAFNCFDTDMTTSSLLPLATDLSQGNLTLYSGTGPTEGADYTYDDQWYCYTNTDGWKQVIDAFTSGQDISNMSYTTPEESIEQAEGDTTLDLATDPSTTTYLSGTFK